jgi:CRISPR system Cascade subunit CasA
MQQFDLITEPWVPVVRQEDGSIVSVGLKEALAQAHLFKAIRHPLPTVEFGLYRLLVALVLDIFFLTAKQDRNTIRLRRLIEKEQFVEAAVEAYFSEYGDRFDLFSETYPFLQDVTTGGDDKPVANLLPSQPSGTNTSHFQHGHEKEFSLTPAEAAQLLVTVAPFMTAGGAGLAPSINGAPPLYVLLTGERLFETVCRNLCALDLALETPQDDAPVWRRKRSIGGEQKKAGYAETLTWTPRRIKLTPGEVVQTMRFSAGDSVRFDWRDPNCAYRMDDKGAVILRVREGKELWRDVGPIALLRGSTEGYTRPRLLDQVKETGYKKKAVSLTLYGMRTDLKMKVFEWQREELAVPTELVEGTVEYRLTTTWMEQAEKAAYQCRLAIKAVYPRGGNGNKNAFNGPIAHSERGFWATLRPVYNKLLSDFASLEPGNIAGREPLREGWKKAVRSAAYAAFETAVGDYDTDNHAIERVTRAQKQLGFGLAAIFETVAEKEAREAKKKAKSEKKPKESNQGVLSL